MNFVIQKLGFSEPSDSKVYWRCFFKKKVVLEVVVADFTLEDITLILLLSMTNNLTNLKNRGPIFKYHLFFSFVIL